MIRCITVILATILSFNSYAKCAPPLLNEATVEISSCQGVVFSASDSKYNIFNSGELDSLHIPGELLSGTLIVGKVIEANKIDSGRAAKVKKAVWSNGEIRCYFVASPPSEVCPKTIPDTRKLLERAKCCDVMPYRGICLIPQTIPVVQVLNR